MPRFKLWILFNCIGQLFVLAESILFEANHCVYSSVHPSLYSTPLSTPSWS